MSNLRKSLEEYLMVRRALGFKLQSAGSRLEKFVSFMEGQEEPFITTQLAVSWAQRNAGILPSGWAANLTDIRLFAQYCSGIDSRTEVPSHSILPYRTQRKEPHIYTSEEVARLLEAASRLAPRSGLLPRTYTTLFGLLATTGLRVGEALGLHRDAVDLGRGVLEVRFTKFNKTRLVPVHRSTLEALHDYARQRDRLHPTPRSPWFFVSPRGGPLYARPLRQTFIQLSRQIGLRGETDRHGPRLHDFRHSFAVHTLLAWYQAGQDVERKLPLLSTYLGHTHPSDTYWYLSATPELLAAATLRLENSSGGSNACE